MTGHTQCDGCGLLYVDTGCGQDDEHAACPRTCGICSLPILYWDSPAGCLGHTIAETVRHVDSHRKRTNGS